MEKGTKFSPQCKWSQEWWELLSGHVVKTPQGEGVCFLVFFYGNTIVFFDRDQNKRKSLNLNKIEMGLIEKGVYAGWHFSESIQFAM